MLERGETMATITDELLKNSETYAPAFDKGHPPMHRRRRWPSSHCMDARLNPYGLLGLREGDAHVIPSDHPHACCGVSDRRWGSRTRRATAIPP
jgi:hypothetical protein